MIEIINISKSFEDVKALNGLTITITDRNITGIVGTNGAGKSTLLRLICGILRPDKGQIVIDGQPVYENPKIKRNIFYISDEPAFTPNDTPDQLADFYKIFYPSFDDKVYRNLMDAFHLGGKRQIRTFSKGMKKTLLMALGISAGTKYLLCDESFDGLDAVMRQTVKGIFADEIHRRDFTPVIATHNLREIDDICGRIGQLHGGKLLGDTEDSFNNTETLTDDDQTSQAFHKIQFVIPDKAAEKELLEALGPKAVKRQGSLTMVVLAGDPGANLQLIKDRNPLFCEEIPLSYEEVFIHEMEAADYEI